MYEVSLKGREFLEIEQTVSIIDFWNSRIGIDTFKIAN